MKLNYKNMIVDEIYNLIRKFSKVFYLFRRLVSRIEVSIDIFLKYIYALKCQYKKGQSTKLYTLHLKISGLETAACAPNVVLENIAVAITFLR